MRPRLEREETGDVVEFDSMDDLYKYNWANMPLRERITERLTEPSGGYIVVQNTAQLEEIQAEAQLIEQSAERLNIFNPDTDINMRVIGPNEGLAEELRDES